MVIKKNAKAELGQSVMSWTCSFLDFCKNAKYHSNTSDLLPFYYTKRVIAAMTMLDVQV